MAILKSHVTEYEFSLDDMRLLIAADLGVDADLVSVTYVEGNTGPGDPMDRYPAPRGVVKIRVTVERDNRQ